jgi:hypothetical protein
MNKNNETAKVRDMTARQRKAISMLVQFIMFFFFAAAGLVSEEITILSIIVLLIAMALAARLAYILWHIRTIDKGRAWIRCTIAAFAISTLLALATDDLATGIFALGLFGLISTAVHFVIWKIVAFFLYHTNPLPSSNPQKQNYDTKDMSKEGKAYIARFDALYAEIPNFKKPPISRQAKHIREAYIQAHGVLVKNPELASAAHELVDYHFPQAMKLLEDYSEFTKKRVKVDNINQILDNIIQSFDTLSGAVDAQLNNLYAGKALDIKTDMAVMKNLK